MNDVGFNTSLIPELYSDNETTRLNIPRTIVSIYMIVLAIFGSLANSYCFFYWSRKQEFKYFASKIFSFIAVCDTVYLLSDVFIYGLKVFVYIPFTHKYHCQIHHGFFAFSHRMSALLLEILAIERFFAVLVPLKVKQICNKYMQILMMMLALSFAGLQIGLVLPFLMLDRYCYINRSGNLMSIYDVYKLVLNLQTFVVLMLTNAFIFIKLVLRNRNSLGGTETKMSKRSLQNVKGVFGLSVLFLIANLPLSLIQYVRAALTSNTAKLNYFYVTLALQATNNGINIFFYFAMIEKFRHYMYGVFGCKRSVEKTFNSKLSTTEY